MNLHPTARGSEEVGFTQLFCPALYNDNDVDHDCGDLYSSAYFYGLSESETDMFSSLD